MPHQYADIRSASQQPPKGACCLGSMGLSGCYPEGIMPKKKVWAGSLNDFVIRRIRPAINGCRMRKLGVRNGLTVKQEDFALHVAGGLSLAESYRRSYDCSNMALSSIHQAASKLMQHDGVRSRVEELLREKSRAFSHKAENIRDHVIDRLYAESIDMDSTPAARVRALELLGKVDAVGMFKDRSEVERIDRSSTEIEAELKAKLAAFLDKRLLEAKPIN